MKILKTLTGLAVSAALMAGVAERANAVPCSGAFTTGDVIASVGNSTADVFTPTGTLVCTLDDASGTTYTTGSGFDSAGNFYLTNFGVGTVSNFDSLGALVISSYMSAGNTPESILNVNVGPYAGSSFVGGPGAAVIDQFNTSTGALIKAWSVEGGNGTGGTDWVDLLNPTTILYDGEGTVLRSYNLAGGVQNADFTSSTTGLDHIYAFRVIPTGTFAGDVLVANSSDAVLLDASGNIINTYTLPGNGGGDFSLNLDPNGVDFWTGDANSGLVWEVNIASGAIAQEWNTGSSSFFGLTVVGELTTAGPPPTVPEPGSLSLLGLVGLGLAVLGLPGGAKRAERFARFATSHRL